MLWSTVLIDVASLSWIEDRNFVKCLHFSLLYLVNTDGVIFHADINESGYFNSPSLISVIVGRHGAMKIDSRSLICSRILRSRFNNVQCTADCKMTERGALVYFPWYGFSRYDASRVIAAKIGIFLPLLLLRLARPGWLIKLGPAGWVAERKEGRGNGGCQSFWWYYAGVMMKGKLWCCDGGGGNMPMTDCDPARARTAENPPKYHPNISVYMYLHIMSVSLGGTLIFDPLVLSKSDINCSFDQAHQFWKLTCRSSQL